MRVIAASTLKTFWEKPLRGDAVGNQYRLIDALAYRMPIAFVKFVGTHAEYDKSDSSTLCRHPFFVALLAYVKGVGGYRTAQTVVR